MNRIARIAAFLALLVALPAAANFHLWTMSELYSSADGKVQFVELRALAGAQQFLSGHGISATSPTGVTHDFDFPKDLPGDTGGKTMVIGTQSFADLHVVTPDYIVPDNFFFQGGGSVSFGPGLDNWIHGALPTTQNLSLNRDGTTSVNSPRNFAGQTGTVVATATAAPIYNVQGLWWREGGTEGGWGVNFVQQGDALFMSWFTYDTDGSNMWLFVSNTSNPCSPACPNVYTGDLLRATGSSVTAYDPSKFANVKVGSATFSFTDANHGTFQYTVNNISQTKPIERFGFASPQPTCDETGAFGASPNYTDLWWRKGGENGWGLNIVHQADQFFLSWFTYDDTGKGQWLYASQVLHTAGTNTYTGDLFRNTGPAFNSATWNSALATGPKIGTVSLTVNGDGTMNFTYTVNGITQTKVIERFRFGTPATSCRYP
jgi:hypothetical protein